MLSTSLTVVDGFPRGIARSVEVLRGERGPGVRIGETGHAYWIAMVGIGIATPTLLALFGFWWMKKTIEIEI